MWPKISSDIIITKSKIAVQINGKTRIILEIKKGETITLEKIKFARPGTGISTNEFYKIEGRRAVKDIKSETIINFNMFKK